MNLLEIMVVFKALIAFLERIIDHTIVLMTDNALVVVYLNKQKGEGILNFVSNKKGTMVWTELHAVDIFARYIIFFPFLSVWGNLYVHRGLMVDLSATQRNHDLPVYISPFPNPMVWNEDAFQHPWYYLDFYVFPPLDLIQCVFNRVSIDRLKNDHGGSSTATMIMVSGPSVFVGGKSFSTTHGMEPLGTAINEETPSGPEQYQVSCLEVIQCLIWMAGFLGQVVKEVITFVRKSSTCVWHGK